MATGSSSAPPRKQFCSLFLESGRKKRDDWCFQVGAVVIGRPAADATHVYFVALDNLLRAHDRKNGAYRWKKDLRYRPSAGPLLVGASVAVPGSVPSVQVFDARRGSPTIAADARRGTRDGAPPDRAGLGQSRADRGADGRTAESLERDAGRACAARPAVDCGRAAHGAAGAGDTDWWAATSSRTAAASRRTPSSIRSGVGAENDNRMKWRPLPLTKNASPDT